jgi:hypothetical protein
VLVLVLVLVLLVLVLVGGAEMAMSQRLVVMAGAVHLERRRLASFKAEARGFAVLCVADVETLTCTGPLCCRSRGAPGMGLVQRQTLLVEAPDVVRRRHRGWVQRQPLLVLLLT